MKLSPQSPSNSSEKFQKEAETLPKLTFPIQGQVQAQIGSDLKKILGTK